MRCRRAGLPRRCGISQEGDENDGVHKEEHKAVQ